MKNIKHIGLGLMCQKAYSTIMAYDMKSAYAYQSSANTSISTNTTQAHALSSFQSALHLLMCLNHSIRCNIIILKQA